VTAIAISRLHFPVTTLGPGRRVGIWVQGCSIRCPGCISADTWAPGRGLTTVDAVVGAIAPWLREAEGVTISGGEPFDQPEALLVLLRSLRERTDADILLYSGHSAEAIAPWLAAADGLFDALVSEPYDQGAPQTLALRGSDNQRLHLLTELGRRRFAAYERPALEGDRRFDVMFDDDGEVWLAGIPANGDMRRLRDALAAAGHRAWTSQATGAERAP
jgi:anaerobic ribonucleoside-triphosphate reductase activating protein